MIYFNIKKVFIENFMDEIMSKILKKIVCENGDCSSNEFKIGPLISLIVVNLIIAASLAVFIDKIIWNGTRYNCNDRSEYLRRSIDAFIKKYQMRRVNPYYIECIISEMQNMTSRMDEIIERDWNKFLNHINEHQQKKVDNEKR